MLSASGFQPSQNDSPCWQQILAVDARFVSYRMSSNPQFKKLYMRRRSQLLRRSESLQADRSSRLEYLNLRLKILSQRYNPKVDTWSNRSTTMAAHTNGSASIGSSGLQRQQSIISWTRRHSPGQVTFAVPATGSLRNNNKRPSRSTAADDYMFAGVYYIFDLHKEPVNRVKFANSDHSRLAFCSDDGSISVCQVQPSPPSVLAELRGHSGPVTDMEWSSANDCILSVSLDGCAKLWLVSSAQCIRTVPDPGFSSLVMLANIGRVNQLTVSRPAELLSCTFHPKNNNLFVVGNCRGQVHVMNGSTGKVCKSASRAPAVARVLSLAWDHDGSLLWTADDKGVLLAYRFDVGTQKISKAARVVLAEGVPITNVSYRTWLDHQGSSPSLLVNVAKDCVRLYSVNSSGQQQRVQLMRQFGVKHQSSRWLVRSCFGPLISNRVGTCVVSGSEDGCVHLFDTGGSASTSFNRLQGHSAAVLDVAFNADESLLASSDALGTVILWRRDLKGKD